MARISRKLGFNKVMMISVIALTLGACTRSADDLGITVKLPIASETQSHQALSPTEKLETLIVNLHNVPNKPNPWFFEFEFRNTQSFGGTIEIPNVPRAPGIVVQVLGVFEDSSLGMTRIGYGGVRADLTRSSEVNITLSTQNQSLQMAELSGRYLKSSSPHPTGRLVAYFQPADGLPKMKVNESQIISGWFRAFALQESGSSGTSAAINFEVESQDGKFKEILFDRLRLNTAGQLTQGSGQSLEPTGTKQVVISKPRTLHKHSGGSEIEGPQRMYLGFFGPGSNSGHRVCYPTVNEGHARVSKVVSGIESPVDMYLSTVNGGTSNDIRVAQSGGVPLPFDVHYSYDSGSNACGPSVSTELLVRHDMLAYSADTALGIEVPFRSFMNLNTPHPEYIQGSHNGSGLTLKWKTLPGVNVALETDGSPITGFDVLYRSRSLNSGGENEGGGDVNECRKLIDRGFSLATSVNDNGQTDHDVIISSLNGQTLTQSNWNSQYEFAVCAYVSDSVSAMKRYVGNYIRSQCMGSCENLHHTGWAPATLNSNLTSNSTFNAMSNPGAISDVQTKALVSSNQTVQLQLAQGTGFSAGDEVLLVVHSEFGEYCGSHQGRNIEVGMSHSSRVIKINGNLLFIHQGSFIDSIPGTVSQVPAPGTNHCFIQAIRVPHFRNFELANSVTLSASPFGFQSSSGGVIALRVNGTLTLGDGSIINVSEAGYGGGLGTNANGGSRRGVASPLLAPEGAEGKASGTAAGGGGAGVVGNGGSNSLGGGLIAYGGSGFGASLQGPFTFAFGGGGGAGYIGATSGGGRGGGFIFISAESFVTPAAPAQKPLFSADGESIDTNTAAIGGGGGGGAINLLFKKSLGPFAVSANGGSGGDNNSVWESTPGGAGNGGGGFISAMVCDLGTSTLASDIDWEAIAGSNEWKVDYGDGSQDGTLKTTGLRSRTSPDGMHICESY